MKMRVWSKGVGREDALGGEASIVRTQSKHGPTLSALMLSAYAFAVANRSVVTFSVSIMAQGEWEAP